MSVFGLMPPSYLSVDDGEEVLNDIAEQNGLLIEQARKIWSFLHRTYHEFFIAQNFTTNSNYSEVKNLLRRYIHDTRWREVLIMISELKDKDSTEYLWLMKQVVDETVEHDEDIQQFLLWLHEKTSSLNSSYQEAAVRAFYFAQGNTESTYRKMCQILDSKLDKDIDEVREVGVQLRKSEYDGISFNPNRLHKIELRRLLYLAETLPAVGIVFDRDATIACLQTYSDERRENVERGYLGRSIALLVKISDQSFRRQLTSIMYSFSDYEMSLEEWRQELSLCLLEYRNLKLDWQFNEQQKQLLKDYHAANRLFIDCLQASNLTVEARQKIQNTILLPIAEIEKRNREKAE